MKSQEKIIIKERVLFVAFLVLSSSSNSSSRMGMVILFVFSVTLVKLEEAAKHLKNKRKDINQLCIVVTLHVLFYCAGLHRLCLAFFTFIFLHDLMVTLHVFFYLVVLASVWNSLHLYLLFHHL